MQQNIAQCPKTSGKNSEIFSLKNIYHKSRIIFFNFQDSCVSIDYYGAFEVTVTPADSRVGNCLWEKGGKPQLYFYQPFHILITMPLAVDWKHIRVSRQFQLPCNVSIPSRK